MAEEKVLLEVQGVDVEDYLHGENGEEEKVKNISDLKFFNFNPQTSFKGGRREGVKALVH